MTPCESDAERWFSVRPVEVERAKAACRPCEQREACLAGAIDRGERWGVWGGELLQEGVVIPRKIGPGRPRKVPS